MSAKNGSGKKRGRKTILLGAAQSKSERNASYEAANKLRGLVRVSLWVPAEDAGEMEAIAKQRRLAASLPIKKDRE